MGEITHTAKKFTFDTEFRGRKDIVSEEARARARVSFTQEEIAQMCARARAEGFDDGKNKAAEKTAAAVETCARAVREAAQHCENDIEIVREKATRVAHAIARKLAGAALAHAPEAEIEDALRAAMQYAVDMPRIVLRTNRAAAGVLEPRLKAIAEEEGFGAEVAVAVDPAMAAGDARIEWPGGGLERKQTALDAAIEDLIERRFAIRSSDANAKGQ